MDSDSKQPKRNYLLRRTREVHNLTLQDVADRLYDMCVEEGRKSGISSDTVGRWERGISIPEAHYRAKLCALFGKGDAELGLLEEPAHADSSLRQHGTAEISLPNTSPSLPGLPFEISDFPPLDKESYHEGGYPSEGIPSFFLGRGGPLTLQKVPLVLIPTHRATDLLRITSGATPEQKLGALLALEANELSTFFDEGWSVEEILETLRILLPGTQAMSKITRRTFGHHLLQLGAAAVVSGISIPPGRHISEEERARLCGTLGDSIAAGWKLLYSISNAQLLAIAHAQLFLVQQNHILLYPKVRSICYAGVYGQIGMAFHFQERDEEALQAYRSSYIAALEAGEPWYVAQSLICQADSYTALGQYSTAIQAIEQALRVIGNPTDQIMTQAKAHLLTCWADNAMMLEDYRITQEKLVEAEVHLDQIVPNEEFDQASWLLIDGKYALRTGDYSKAKDSFEKALGQLPDHWVLRRVMTAIGLAMALARMRERKESLAITEKLTPLVKTVDAQLTNRWFHEYLQQDFLGTFPKDDQVHKLVSDTYKQIPRLASSPLQQS